MTPRRRCALLLGALLALCAPALVDSRIWLYTLVAADYDGAALLPHFVNYYRACGVPLHRMLVMVHHTPRAHPRAGVDAVAGLCSGYTLECRFWEGVFSSEAHLERLLAMLNDYVYDPGDWILLADNDEFQQWPGGSIPDALARAQGEGASYVTGTLLDRVARGGRVLPIAPVHAHPRPGSLFAQFPLRCRVVKKLYKGWDFKVAAFRAFLRSGRANHEIVTADKARAYFGPCAPKPARCARGRNINLGADWFNATPYARWPARYRYKSTPPEVHGWPGFGLWEANAWGTRLPIHHFKWHAGVLGNMRDRAAAYSGDCVLGVNEKNCTPALLHWKESAKTYAALKDTRRLELAGMGCVDPSAPGADLGGFPPDPDVDTVELGEVDDHAPPSAFGKPPPAPGGAPAGPAGAPAAAGGAPPAAGGAAAAEQR